MVTDLWAWYRHWSRVFNDDDAVGEDYAAERRIDLQLIELEGLRLWPRVQRELAGRYQVWFYSELVAVTFADLSQYRHFMARLAA